MRAFACTRDTEERGRENGLRLAKPSFAARPVRLDPSHFYHPGLATTDESRIGCGGTNERGGRRRRGWPRRARKTERVVSGPSCAPSRGPSRLPARLALPSPHQPAGSFELAAFCGGSTTSRLGATHAEASSGSHATLGLSVAESGT